MEKELENYIRGKWLGSGIHRVVHVFNPDPTLVVKIALGDHGRAINLQEDRMWWDLRDTPIGKWFSPTVSVSGAGLYLLQKRVEYLPHDQYPKEIPSFFTDTKYSNFGYLAGRGFVCCDYGCFNMWCGVKTRLKKVEWWEG